nr:IclR family transcriptional regulator C-terminal domain-containing protein [Brooklawnia cerclae]
MQTLARGLSVIRALNASDQPQALSEVADACGVPRAVARRILRSLETMGFATSRNRLWSLTPRALALADAYLESAILPGVALGPMRSLAGATHQSTSLAVRDGFEAVYVQRIPGRRIVHAVIRIGTRIPLHATAMGRVLLAGETEEAMRNLLEEMALRPLTGATRTSPDEIMAVVDDVRSQGFCVVRGEFEPELVTVAVPVLGPGGAVIAALNLPTPLTEFDESQVAEKVTALRATASEIGEAYTERVTPPG